MLETEPLDIVVRRVSDTGGEALFTHLLCRADIGGCNSFLWGNLNNQSDND